MMAFVAGGHAVTDGSQMREMARWRAQGTTTLPEEGYHAGLRRDAEWSKLGSTEHEDAGFFAITSSAKTNVTASTAARSLQKT